MSKDSGYVVCLTARCNGLAALFGVICAALTGVAHADGFPSHPVRIIVSSAPGSGPDVVARLIGQQLTGALGQSIVIDNRPGAGGNLGAEVAARGRGCPARS